MSDRIDTPFSLEQVLALNRFQTSGLMHPFTCGNRSRETHAVRWGDFGILVATVDGWRCPDCDYRQTWAHAFMGDFEAQQQMLEARAAILRLPQRAAAIGPTEIGGGAR